MKVYCILSDERASQSKSPIMHNSVFRKMDIQAVYVPFQVAHGQLAMAISGLRALNISGANVTVPFKESAIPYLDTTAEEVTAVGAVNTIVSREGRLRGYNTDIEGFQQAIGAAGHNPAGQTALVFGTGGAARAVCYALKCMGAHVVVAGRDFPKAQAVADVAQGNVVNFDFLGRDPYPADLVVNVTSVSTNEEAPDLAAVVSSLRIAGCRLVVDINYGRAGSFWQDLAHSMNAQFMDGLPMLAHQARKSFELWTGYDVPVDLFLDALEARR